MSEGFSINGWYPANDVQAGLRLSDEQFAAAREWARDRNYWRLEPNRRDSPDEIHGSEINLIRGMFPPDVIEAKPKLLPPLRPAQRRCAECEGGFPRNRVRQQR